VTHTASTRLLIIAAAPFDAAAAAAAAAAAPPSTQRAAVHAQAKSDQPSPRKPRPRKAAAAPVEQDWREQVAGAMGKTTLVNRKRLNPDAPRPGTPKGDGPVLYWCSRDQRAADNWALLVRSSLPRLQPLLLSRACARYVHSVAKAQAPPSSALVYITVFAKRGTVWRRIGNG